MINKIIDGISMALGNSFGSGYEIYTESVEQGLEEPAFSIVCLNPTQTQFLGKRYFKTNLFCIHYFPGSKDKRAECNEATEKLFTALELITVDGDLVRGTNMHSEFTDGVLHFFVNYDLYVYKEVEREPSMETYIQETGMKG